MVWYLLLWGGKKRKKGYLRQNMVGSFFFLFLLDWEICHAGMLGS